MTNSEELTNTNLPLPPEWQDYLDKITPHLSVVRSKKVLEIGPFNGWTSVRILQYFPEHLTLVENNKDAIEVLTQCLSKPNVAIIKNDIYHFLEKDFLVDVVVLFGVLYHLHSPIYLLELIANRCNPEVFLLETIPSGEHAYHKEYDNEPGNRYVNEGWKSAGLTTTLKEETILLAMGNLGYSLDNIIRPDYTADVKKNTVLYKFRRN
jgi:SAM-dependent methyltransferase